MGILVTNNLKTKITYTGKHGESVTLSPGKNTVSEEMIEAVGLSGAKHVSGGFVKIAATSKRKK